MLDRQLGMPRTVPAARTRAEGFDDLVLAAVEELEERWAAQLRDVEFAVEEVPEVEVTPDGGVEVVRPDPGAHPDEVVPLARLHPAAGSGRDQAAARIVLYRRPIEARSGDLADRADLVLDVVVHEVARLLGRTPEEIDPEGHSEWDDDD